MKRTCPNAGGRWPAVNFPRVLTVAYWLVAGLPAWAQLPPTFTLQPQNQTVCAGGDATFQAAAAGGQPLDFHWYWNAVPVFSEFGVTNSTLTLTNVQFPDHNSPVYVLVLNPWGNLPSDVAQLFVPDPHLCAAPTDTSAPAGAAFQFHVGAAGSPPLTYQWWFQRTGFPAGSPLTNSPKIFGVNTPGLTVINLHATNTGVYWVAVTNTFSMGITSSPALGFVGMPPTLGNLTSRIVRVNGSTVMNPPFTGTAPLAFQWFRNDVAIPGAINSILVLPSVQRAQVGLYHLRISNGAGVVSGNQAHVQVRLTLEGSLNIFREEATDELVSLTNAIADGGVSRRAALVLDPQCHRPGVGRIPLWGARSPFDVGALPIPAHGGHARLDRGQQLRHGGSGLYVESKSCRQPRARRLRQRQWLRWHEQPAAFRGGGGTGLLRGGGWRGWCHRHGTVADRRDVP
jgi:hypothetical protein